MSLTHAAALAQVTRPDGMDAAAASAVLDLLMGGTLTPEQGAALLVAWSRRGETGAELAAVVQGLLARAVRIPDTPRCIDVVGAGGSGLTRFNISTSTAFILAAAGVPVAKHGNRGTARPNGSFDFIEALGIPFQLPPASIAQLLAETGVCFLFARAMHPAMAAVAPYRKLAASTVKRTIFNLAGPLANPCRPVRQLIGVADQRVADVVTTALVMLGTERSVVVCGHPGLDEVSVTGDTRAWEVVDGRVTAYALERLPRHDVAHEQLPGGNAPDNAALFERLLDGSEQGPLRDMLLVNAGAALDTWAGRPVQGMGEGMELARRLLDSGLVRAAVERHRKLAKELAAGW